MANLKRPIFDLKRTRSENPPVSLEDPMTKRNVWTDILQNPVLSQNYEKLQRRRICAAFKEQVTARLIEDSCPDVEEEDPELALSTDVDYTRDCFGNRLRLSIVDPNTGEDKWEDILQTKTEQAHCVEQGHGRSSLIDPDTGKDVWSEIQKDNKIQRNIQDMENKRTRARFKEQVRQSLICDNTTNLDQLTEAVTERSLRREGISIVDPNTGEKIIFNPKAHESKDTGTDDEDQYYWQEGSCGGQFYEGNTHINQYGSEVELSTLDSSQADAWTLQSCPIENIVSPMNQTLKFDDYFYMGHFESEEDKFNTTCSKKVYSWHNNHRYEKANVNQYWNSSTSVNNEPGSYQQLLAMHSRQYIDLPSDFEEDYNNVIEEDLSEVPNRSDRNVRDVEPIEQKLEECPDTCNVYKRKMIQQCKKRDTDESIEKTEAITIKSERKLEGLEKMVFNFTHGMIIECTGLESLATLVKSEILGKNQVERRIGRCVTVDNSETNLNAGSLSQFSFTEVCGDPSLFGLHQLFITPSTLLIFIVDMTKDLNMKMDVGLKGSKLSDFTYKDYLLMWFEFIQDTSELKRQIVLIGSQKEERSEKDTSPYVEEISQMIEEKDLNKISVVSLHEESTLYESKFASCVRAQTLEKTIPIRWFSWYKVIESTFTQGHKIAMIEKLWSLNKEIAKESRLESIEEIKHVLKIFGDVGKVLFKEQLSDIVVLDIQWFIDAVSKIMSSLRHKTVEIKSLKVNCILSQNFDKISENGPMLLSYIELVGLGSKCSSSDAWYFPTINTQIFDTENFAEFQSSSVLVFKFKYHAKFIFDMLVSMCISRNKWPILQDGNTNCLYQSEAVFFVKNHNILLRTCRNDIKVQILWLKNIPVDHELTSNAKNQICALFDQMKSWTHDIQYQTGFSCNNKLKMNNEDDLFISLDEVNTNSLLQCPKCPVRFSHAIDVPSMLKFWIPEEEHINSCKKDRANLTAIDTCGTCFKKDTLKTCDALTSDLKSVVSKSVGMIRHEEHPKGTGFRVGENMIMTNLHVVKPYLTGKLQALSIVFELKVPNAVFLPKNYFNFLPKIHFIDEELDVVILELKRHEFPEVNFPPPISDFSEIDFESEVHLIGHPGGIHMKEDSQVYPMPRNEMTLNFIHELEGWSVMHFPDKKNYYSPLHDKHKILMHTTFDRGSSGSPGIAIKGNVAKVVLMLSGGVPSCFYDGTYTKVPHDKLVEYGVSMTDIYLRLVEKNGDLCKAVFNS